MHGTIEVHSSPGAGTTFHIQLELDSVPATANEQITLAEPLPDYAPLTGKHILLCEDHPLNQEIAKTLLQEKGMIVVVAENGQAGLEEFSTSAPGYYDAILMDIRMPVMDGYEATRQIRALERADAKKVPIIAMTADAFAESVRKAEQAGMNRHLTKPVDPAKLYFVLQASIGQG